MRTLESLKPCRHTLDLARRRQEETGRTQYVVRAGEIYVIEEWMPMLGEWYTADGIRHG